MDQTVTLQFGFHFDSLSIILYNNDSHQVHSVCACVCIVVVAARDDSFALESIQFLYVGTFCFNY